MISLARARKMLADQVQPLPCVAMRFAESAGLHLADEAKAAWDLPASDVSVMDGYAGRAADLKAERALPVAFEVPAGQVPRSLPVGAVARIFTGAVLPDGSDTVVPQEEADRQEDGSVLLAPFERGRFIRYRGELCAADDVLADRGKLITPQRAALLASAGVDRVMVTPLPRVALLSTGSELVGIDEQPGRGELRDSNGLMMAMLAANAGVAIQSAERVEDTSASLHAAMQRAADAADIVVTTGGVSVGDYDLVPEALAARGATTVFHGLAMRPGRPLLVAGDATTWFVGLPGNPLSTFACWRMFVGPLIRALGGDASAFEEVPEAGVLEAPAQNNSKRLTLAPARVEHAANGPRVVVIPGKGSHDLVSLAGANALAVLEIGANLAAGTEIPFYRLS